VRTFLYSQRWWIASGVFAGIAMACAAKHGEIEYAADHVWEEADKANAQAVREELPKE